MKNEDEQLASAALRHRRAKEAAGAAACDGTKPKAPKPVPVVTAAMVDAVKPPLSAVGSAGLRQHYVLLLGVAAIAMAQYANSVHNDLVFDDHLAIRNNPMVDPTKSTLLEMLSHDFWGKLLTAKDSHKSWRPLTTFSFRQNVAASGGFSAFDMHMTNNVLHAGVSALVAHVGYELFRCRLTATLSGALFALHPVHVESVSSIVGRSELLCTLFMLLALLCYKHRQYSDFAVATALAVLCKETGLTVLGVALAYDVLVWGGWAHASRGMPPLWSGRAHSRTRILFLQRVGGCVAIFAIAIAVRLYLMVGEDGDWWKITLEHSQLVRRAENPFKFLDGLPRVLSYAYLQVRYARLLLWPSELCCEYSFDCIPAVESLSDARNLQSLGLLLGIGALITSLFHWKPGATGAAAGAAVDAAAAAPEDDSSQAKKSKKGKKTLVVPSGLANAEVAARTTCIAMVVLPYLPASGLLFTVGTLVAERLLYMPSTGVCLLVGRLFARAIHPTTGDVDYSDASARRPAEGTVELEGQEPAAPSTARKLSAVVAMGVFGALCTLAGTATFERTKDWATDETLFRSALDVCPNSAKINQQFGQIQLNHASPMDPTAYKSAGARAKAAKHAEALFLRAREIDPDFCDIDFNLGMVSAGRHDYGTASELFKKSLHCVFTSQRAFSNLQLIWQAYMQVGRPRHCLIPFFFHRALSIA